MSIPPISRRRRRCCVTLRDGDELNEEFEAVPEAPVRRHHQNSRKNARLGAPGTSLVSAAGTCSTQWRLRCMCAARAATWKTGSRRLATSRG